MHEAAILGTILWILSDDIIDSPWLEMTRLLLFTYMWKQSPTVSKITKNVTENCRMKSSRDVARGEGLAKGVLWQSIYHICTLQYCLLMCLDSAMYCIRRLDVMMSVLWQSNCLYPKHDEFCHFSSSCYMFDGVFYIVISLCSKRLLSHCTCVWSC